MALLNSVLSHKPPCLQLPNPLISSSTNHSPLTRNHSLGTPQILRVDFPASLINNGKQQTSRSLHHSSLIQCVSTTSSESETTPDVVLKRSDFPVDFKFGATSSSIQTEGKEGRGANTWDRMIPDKAVDSLTKYTQDVDMLKFMGADAYRMGISWSRLFPEGTGEVCQEGLDYYNKFIDLLLQNGIQPFITLFHFNMPVALKKKNNGFLSEKIVDDYVNFADTCFKHFGDRVKHWVTFNEPQVWSAYGYKTNMITTPDPAKDPYNAAHNIILSHAAAAKLYREKYQASQGGEIGMSLSVIWNMPWADSPDHIDACKRAWDFHFGWFAEPLTTGDYPFSMKSLVRDRLPTFTKEQQEMVKGSYDFIGINYYTSTYAQALPINPKVDVPTSYDKDQYLTTSPTNSDGHLIGPNPSGSAGINIYPPGIREVLRQAKQLYTNPKFYITENGYPTKRDDSNPVWKELDDDYRVDFLKDMLTNVRDALRIDGVNVNGYLMWSLMDNVEWASNYDVRFGLSFVDYNNDFMRYPKKSAKWLRDFNMENKN